MKNLFLSCFPVPDFLKMPSVGLDISDGTIRFVELVDSNYGKVLGRFGKIKFDDSLFYKGEIKDRAGFLALLKKIKDDLGCNFVRLSIVENSSFIFKTKIAWNKKLVRDDIRGALFFKLEENIPMNINDIVFDFDIIGLKEDYLEIVVSVLPKKIVDQFVSVFKEAKIIPLSFEVEAQATARSLVGKKTEHSIMIVDFRSNRTTISVVNNGFVQLTSTVDIGGEDLVKAIKKVLNVDDVEARRLKKEKGLIKDKSNEELFFSVMNSVAALKDEINKYLFYWHSREENQEDGRVKNFIDKIILCGENASLFGLDDYLALSLGVKVEKGDVWKNIFSFNDFVPEMDRATSLEYAAAIGLAMRADEKFFSPNKVII